VALENRELEKRVEELSHQVEDLRRRVDELSTGRQVAPPIARTESRGSPPEQADAGEELLSWMGQSSLLPRISTACFLLVLALVLRTITDNDLLDKQVGSLVGMVYAGLLISISWYKYDRKSPLAPIFAVCGAVLMYTIVLETHDHFESLPSIPAYVLLVVTGIGMASISYFYQNALPVLVGSLGMGIAAVAIDYPNPHFPYLALVLLVANLLGAFATRLQRCSWLRWILLILTILMVQAWGLKIGIRLSRGTASEMTALGLHWYLPVVAVFALAFQGIAFWAIFRRSIEKVSRFDLALPVVNALWAFGAALYLLRVWGSSLVSLGLVGLAWAALQFGIATWIVRQREIKTRGANAYVLAGTVLLVIDLPILFGSVIPALGILSLVAVGLFKLSLRWGRGGIRAISYLLQVALCVWLVYQTLENSPGKAAVWTGLTAGAMTAFGLMHFVWCRRNKPSADSWLFSRMDAEDRTGVFVLMSALVSAFFLARTVLYWLLLDTGESLAQLFQGGQSVIVNFAGAGLLLLSFSRRDKELRNVAIFVSLVGAGRVFIMDLFHIRGIALVGSILSFGLAMSLVSVVLTRWQKRESREEGGKFEGAGASAVSKHRPAEENGLEA
jgi:hypothetical protein